MQGLAEVPCQGSSRDAYNTRRLIGELTQLLFDNENAYHPHPPTRLRALLFYRKTELQLNAAG